MHVFNDLLMPKLGLTMTEGTLVEWSVASGDQVVAGDVLFVVETDKVANEVTAQADGQMGDILVPAGETVPVGTVVARWTGPGQSNDGDSPEEPGEESSLDPAPVPSSKQVAPPPAHARSYHSERVVATPLARRLAREHDIDLHAVTGSGPRGRIKAVDVRGLVNTPSRESGADQESSARQPAGGLVQAMARRMVESKSGIPHFYLASEVDVSELLRVRRELNRSEDLPRLTVNHFILAAVARALHDLPEQNRIWLDGDIVQFDTIDIGVAVSTERGLLAPVLHDLGGSSLEDTAARAGELVQRVRDGKISRSEMEGGAITVSNAGMFDVTYMTPIINPPQSAILGVGSVRDVFRPDEEGAPVLRREMGLVLAADHRLHDGTAGLRFLNRIMTLLGNPYRLLRGIAQ